MYQYDIHLGRHGIVVISNKEVATCVTSYNRVKSEQGTVPIAPLKICCFALSR